MKNKFTYKKKIIGRIEHKKNLHTRNLEGGFKNSRELMYIILFTILVC